MAYEATIEQFKGVLKGGGVRPTMFQVSLSFPEGVVSDGLSADGDRRVTFLCKGASLPPSNIGEIPIPFRGRTLKVAGDRTFDDWAVTVINDDSFLIKRAMEKWSEKIQRHNYALGETQLANYFSDGYVRQLDRDASVLRTYAFRGIWPKSISEIALSFDSGETVEDYEVSFAVQYWTATNSEEAAEAQNQEGAPPDISDASVIDS